MDVPRAPLVQSRHNAAQAIATLRIDELMAAQAKS
jgi:hypothetical protein